MAESRGFGAEAGCAANGLPLRVSVIAFKGRSLEEIQSDLVGNRP
jgi:hypothetical protein